MTLAGKGERTITEAASVSGFQKKKKCGIFLKNLPRPRSDAPELERGAAIRADGAVLRQLHAWLKQEDPSFGGLIRVQNKRNEFLWVHPMFEGEY